LIYYQLLGDIWKTDEVDEVNFVMLLEGSNIILIEVDVGYVVVD
jgi:hypothetical protein